MVRYRYDLDLIFSPELSYLAGAILGDGCLHYNKSTRQYFVNFSSVDLEFIEKVRDYLGRINKLDYKPSLYKRDNISSFCNTPKLIYKIRIYSEKLYHFLKDWILVKSLARQYPKEFIKGFVDAEGSITERYGFIRISQRDRTILIFIQGLFKLFDYTSYFHLRKRGSYYILLSCESSRKYIKEIGFTIKRKQRVGGFL